MGGRGRANAAPAERAGGRVEQRIASGMAGNMHGWQHDEKEARGDVKWVCYIYIYIYIYHTVNRISLRGGRPKYYLNQLAVPKICI